MLFNSLEFLLFLPIVFFVYWFLLKKDYRKQNAFVLLMSYVFYAWWDWRFLFLLVFSTALDYFSGLMISNALNPVKRKFWLVLSVGINLGFLGFFKYYNFFVESLKSALESSQIHIDTWTLSIVLPVGISFYTFHGLSYVIDIYYKRIEPCRNWINYSVFVSYFPLLVAGPIERATHLLPQIEKPRKFNFTQAMSGFKLMLWGFFKKIAIADNLAPSVNEIFSHHQSYSGSVLLLGAFLFAIQIYGDFSGYSDIARGISRFFGMELLLNFNFPYFSRNIAEFWRRWHISLSGWFRDYLYIPLGGSRKGTWLNIRNVFIIFLVSGFWHGANWTFVAWGFIHALLFLPNFLLKAHKKDELNLPVNSLFLPSIKDVFRIIMTFVLVTLAWIFFRAETIQMAFSYIGGIFQWSIFEPIGGFLNPYDNQSLFKEFILIAFLFIAEYLYFVQSKKDILNSFAFELTYSVVMIILIILNVPLNSSNSFIYFQF